MKKIYLFTVLLTVLLTSCKMGLDGYSEYYVVHLQQNLEDNGYTEIERETFTGVDGHLTEAEAKEYEGFTAQKFVQEKISSKKEIQIKYDRNAVTFTLNLTGGTGVTSVTQKYGTAVTTETVPNPTNDGAAFSFWLPELPETFTEDGTYTANWNYTSYKVKYFFQNIKDDDYSEDEAYPEQTFYGKIGEKITISPETIDSFEAQNVETVELKEDGQTIEVYYNRKIVTLFIDLDGGDGNSYVTGKAGAAVSKSLFGEIKKTGYSNGGFDKDLPATFAMEDNNKTVAKVIWVGEGEARYGVKFYKQSRFSNEDAYYEAPELKEKSKGKIGELTKVEYNQATNQYIINGNAIDITGFHPVAATSGYTLKNLEITGDETTVVKVYLDRNISTYTLDLNGGYLVNGDSITVTGRYEESVVMPVIARKGYTRHSELWENPDKDLIYFPPESTTKTYKAKWQANHYTVKYDVNRLEGTMPVTKVPTDTTLEYDSSAVKLNATLFERKYHTFAGLNTKADGSGTAINPDDPMLNLTDEPDGEVTLYCQWEPYRAKEMRKVEVWFDTNVGHYGEIRCNFMGPNDYDETSSNSFFKKDCCFISVYVDGEFAYRHAYAINNYNSSYGLSCYYGDKMKSSTKYQITCYMSIKYEDDNGEYYLDAEPAYNFTAYSPLPDICNYTDWGYFDSYKYFVESVTSNSATIKIDIPICEDGYEEAKIKYGIGSINQEYDILSVVEPGKTNRIVLPNLEKNTDYKYFIYLKDKHGHEINQKYGEMTDNFKTAAE